MEIEYKWSLDEADQNQAREAAWFAGKYITNARDIAMATRYFDTEDGLVRKNHAGLRMRNENDALVCCLKISAGGDDGLSRREEYEVEAVSLEAGLSVLPDAGAPRELCTMFSQADLKVICEAEFDRRAYRLEVPKMAPQFVAELAVDEGVLRHEGRELAFKEMELELLEGSEEMFHQFAAELEIEANLQPQEKSKLARALSL